MTTYPDAKCSGCRFFQPTSLFDECQNPASRYRFDDKEYWHTVNHMRTRGPCGAAALLFKAKGTE